MPLYTTEGGPTNRRAIRHSATQCVGLQWRRGPESRTHRASVVLFPHHRTPSAGPVVSTCSGLVCRGLLDLSATTRRSARWRPPTGARARAHSAAARTDDPCRPPGPALTVSAGHRTTRLPRSVIPTVPRAAPRITGERLCRSPEMELLSCGISELTDTSHRLNRSDASLAVFRTLQRLKQSRQRT